MRLTTDKINLLVLESLKQGREYFPRPFPTIQDREDQESDFLYGVALGLRKMRRQKFRLKRGHGLVQFLVSNGMWTLRRKRSYQMRRKLQVLCVCGKKLGYIWSSRSWQKPCHGTIADRTVHLIVVTANPDWIMNFDGKNPIKKNERSTVVDTGGGDHAYQGA